MADRVHGIPAEPTTSRIEPDDWDPRDASGGAWDAVLFPGVDMREATVTAASFTGCTFRDVKFNASVFRDTAFTNCTFVACTLFDVRFEACKLVGSLFDGCTFDLLVVERGDWSLVGLPGADLRRATFRGARMREVDLVGARLDGAAVRDTDLSGALTHEASFRGTDLRGSDLSSIDPVHSDVTDALIDPEQAMTIAAALGLRFA